MAVQEVSTVSDDDLLVASLVGDRSDFVIDLRDGRKQRSYLRAAPNSADTLQPRPPGASKKLRSVRRVLDVVTSGAAMVVSFPLMLAVAAAIWFESRGAILFRQERVGRNGEIFTCLKFRSMHLDADERLKTLLSEDGEFREEWMKDQKATNDPRITKVGNFIRKTSLDELPQFFNVFRGDMSFVGPRPVLPAETLRYGDAINEVLSVKPGLTGLWQVSGRNSISYEERILLDLRYVRSQSLALDAIVIAKTITGVASGDGAM